MRAGAGGYSRACLVDAGNAEHHWRARNRLGRCIVGAQLRQTIRKSSSRARRNGTTRSSDARSGSANICRPRSPGFLAATRSTNRATVSAARAVADTRGLASSVTAGASGALARQPRLVSIEGGKTHVDNGPGSGMSSAMAGTGDERAEPMGAAAGEPAPPAGLPGGVFDQRRCPRLQCDLETVERRSPAPRARPGDLFEPLRLAPRARCRIVVGRFMMKGTRCLCASWRVPRHHVAEWPQSSLTEMASASNTSRRKSRGQQRGKSINHQSARCRQACVRNRWSRSRSCRRARSDSRANRRRAPGA